MTEVIDVPDSVGPLVEYHRTIAGEHPDRDGYRTAMLPHVLRAQEVPPRRASP